jgi:alkylated DNA repair protein alkB homolog 6
LLASPLQPFLVHPIVDRFQALGIFNSTPHQAPNHVLINEYKPGEGIMPHEDGSAYARVVATVSLGASICLDITSKPGRDRDDEEIESQTEAKNGKYDNKSSANELGDSERPHSAPAQKYNLPTRIIQEPRSLLVTTGAAYTDLLHGILATETDKDLSPDTVANWDLLSDPQTIIAAGGRIERATRISLTYRDVLKVSSAASKVLGGLSK